MIQTLINADANATYPVRSAHYEAVAKRLQEVDGNPSSIHARGRGAKIALEDARAAVAALLGARPSEVIFTSGATEANNLAVQGLVGARAGAGADPPHVVVGATEHKAVLDTVELLRSRGACTVAVAPARPTGELDADALLRLVRLDTALVAVMAANNETGAINDVLALARHLKEVAPQAHVHVDAVQLLGKADLAGYGASLVDSAAFSAHKFGAYKGVGALYLKGGAKLSALLAGGGQERGRRPGTENLPGIVSFGLRAAELKGTVSAAAEAMRRARDAWLAELAAVPGAVVHGGAPAMLPNTVNFHVDGVPGDDFLLNFDLAGILASSGSACSSGVARPSHVLLAMGLGEWVALNSVRVSFTAETRDEDVATMAKVLREVVARVRG